MVLGGRILGGFLQSPYDDDDARPEGLGRPWRLAAHGTPFARPACAPSAWQAVCGQRGARAVASEASQKLALYLLGYRAATAKPKDTMNSEIPFTQEQARALAQCTEVLYQSIAGRDTVRGGQARLAFSRAVLCDVGLRFYTSPEGIVSVRPESPTPDR